MPTAYYPSPIWARLPPPPHSSADQPQKLEIDHINARERILYQIHNPKRYFNILKELLPYTDTDKQEIGTHLTDDEEYEEYEEYED